MTVYELIQKLSEYDANYNIKIKINDKEVGLDIDDINGNVKFKECYICLE